MKSVPERILERCKVEAANILARETTASFQEEELLSPVIKYLAAYANQPEMCTETQISKNLSIPRPMTKKVIQALEAYQVVEPLADFGTVKPYKVSKIATAVKAAWVRLEPEDVKLLFSVRDGSEFRVHQGHFEYFVSTPRGSRWLPPMGAASSFFSAMTDSLELVKDRKKDYRLEHVDAAFLSQLLQDFHPVPRDELFFLEEEEEITQKDLERARTRCMERYCWIYCLIAGKLLAQDPEPRQEYLGYMGEILQSCVKVAQAFGAEKGHVDEAKRLLKKVEERLAG